MKTFENLRLGKKQTVVVYGTSHSHTAEWPNAMRAYFEDRFPGLVSFVNSAMSGQQSNWGLDNLRERVLAKHPDLVFIEFSINDAATKHHISQETSPGNLDQMVTVLHRQNSKLDIILQTMNPVWDWLEVPLGKRSASDRPHLNEYYELYRKYARGHGLPLVDHYANWIQLRLDDEEKFKQWLPDGTHPIPEASLAVTWPAIEALLSGSASSF